MPGKWIKLILAASIALNVAFLSTTLYHWYHGNQTHHRGNRSQGETRVPPPLVIPDKIDFELRAEQRKDIHAIIKKFKMDMLNYKQDILDKRIAIIEALSDAEFNPDEIDKKTTELNELENQLNIIFVDALVQVNNILDAKQRLNFLLHLSKNWFFMPDHARPPSTEGEKHD